MLRFVSELRPQRRGWLGFELPRAAAHALGSRGQVRVNATIGGVNFETVAFPRGDGSHFIPMKSALRQRLGLLQGQRVEVAVERASPLPPVPTPEELRAELSKSRDAQLAWKSLTPAARQIASRWVGSAKAVEVRRFRSRDVVRRALRYRSGEGPFYPTTADQKLLSRPRRAHRRG
ncbi:MAG: YdeI/OmpD-associated family protein [Gaiellaceae bacterium]